MKPWDVTYTTRDGRTAVVQVDAASLTLARAVALPLVGTRGAITRIDRAYPVRTCPCRPTIQGAP